MNFYWKLTFSFFKSFIKNFSSIFHLLSIIFLIFMIFPNFSSFLPLSSPRQPIFIKFSYKFSHFLYDNFPIFSIFHPTATHLSIFIFSTYFKVNIKKEEEVSHDMREVERGRRNGWWVEGEGVENSKLVINFTRFISFTHSLSDNVKGVFSCLSTCKI